MILERHESSYPSKGLSLSEAASTNKIISILNAISELKNDGILCLCYGNLLNSAKSTMNVR